MGRILVACLAVLVGLGAGPRPAPPSEFSNWAAVVIAGDWHAHDGGETQAFDNTRRDVSAALTGLGFQRDNIREYSLRPLKPGDDAAVVTDAKTAMEGFQQLAAKASAGCLFYVTSHGSPDGALFGPDWILPPPLLDKALSQICGTRPTVVVISACFSGVYVPALSAPNRMVMTAARPDRSSFGCSSEDKYPYFDACVLESFPGASDFAELSRRTRECVSRRETQQHLSPASEPQTYVGGQIAELMPFLEFSHP